jgi:RimJ/RimL family protein N-acetyltransferase
MLGNKLITGDNVHFDAISRDDLSLINKWHCDTEILNNIRNDAVYPQSEKETEEWYEKIRGSKDSYYFFVRLNENNRAIGYVCLMRLNFKSRSGVFGIMIGEKDCRDQGYGTEAARLMVRYGFWELNLNRIELEVVSFNKRAIHSYEKIGFQREVVKRQALYRGGEYHDMIIMGLLCDEWEAAGGGNF